MDPDALLCFNGTAQRDPAIETWFQHRTGALGAIAREWFERMRACGDDVREVIHDGAPTACVGDAGFGYVNVFKTHVNVGFFLGAELKDPGRLLQGEGRRMRHVKLRPGDGIDAAALKALIEEGYARVRARRRKA